MKKSIGSRFFNFIVGHFVNMMDIFLLWLSIATTVLFSMAQLSILLRLLVYTRTFKSEKRVVEGLPFSPAIFLDGRNRVAEIGFSFPKILKGGRQEGGSR
jgi:hypothetical protein